MHSDKKTKKWNYNNNIKNSIPRNNNDGITAGIKKIKSSAPSPSSKTTS